MAATIRVLIADDHELLVTMLADRLAQEQGLKVVGRVHTTDEAVALARTERPDVLLLDIDLPGQVCFDAARQIKKDRPEAHVVYVSAFFNDRYIEDAIRSGCSGYVTKDEPVHAIITAIHQAVGDGAYFSPKVRERLVIDPEKGLTLDGASATRASMLSARELEVLRYLAQGLSKKEIAAQLHRSVSTVDKHVENLMRKLDIHDRVEIARYAIREGLVEP